MTMNSSRYRKYQPPGRSASTGVKTFFSGQHMGEPTAEPISTEPVAAPLLTDRQVRDAITYMRHSYSLDSIQLLRAHFSLSAGRIIDRDLVLAIAQYQQTNGLAKVDGKLGTDTYDTLMASGPADLEDLVIFRVTSPRGGGMLAGLNTAGTADFEGHFKIDILFPPGQDASKFYYRQFICARVEMLPANADPAGPLTNLRPLFTVPGGLRAIPNYTEDGNTTLNARFGHREMPATDINHYLNDAGGRDQANGRRFKAEDFPGIHGRVVAAGEQYEFDFRFRGEVHHADRGLIATKYWSVRADFFIDPSGAPQRV